MNAKTRRRTSTLSVKPVRSRDNGPGADRDLVDRCLVGDASAWEQMYARHHDGLLRSIRVLLGPKTSGPELVDEIAARVWYAVVSNHAEVLNRFDADRGCRLSTFLAAVARAEVSQFFRSENRRRRRESVASRTASQQPQDSERSTLTELTAFIESLTRREREYCLTELISNDHGENSFSRANGYQLRRRIRVKLLQFVSSDSKADADLA